MFESDADKHINNLIEELCHKATHRMYAHEADERQMLIAQIAQLRASQNPIIQMPR